MAFEKDFDSVTFPEGSALAFLLRSIAEHSPACFFTAEGVELEEPDGLLLKVTDLAYVSQIAGLTGYEATVGVRCGWSKGGDKYAVAFWSFGRGRLGLFWVPADKCRKLYLSPLVLRLINGCEGV